MAPVIIIRLRFLSIYSSALHKLHSSFLQPKTLPRMLTSRQEISHIAFFFKQTSQISARYFSGLIGQRSHMVTFRLGRHEGGKIWKVREGIIGCVISSQCLPQTLWGGLWVTGYCPESIRLSEDVILAIFGNLRVMGHCPPWMSRTWSWNLVLSGKVRLIFSLIQQIFQRACAN